MAKYEEHATFHEHPAYGMVGFSRLHGGKETLFGSSIQHHEVVRMRVSRAVHKRDLSHDWYHADGRSIVELDLSLTQFAELITSFGHGDGFPCTLKYVDGERMPDPEWTSKRETFEGEFRRSARTVAEKFDETVKAASELAASASASKKERAALAARIADLRQEVASNIPFLATAFNEQMDRTATEAKGEVEAFFYRKVMSAGLESLVASGELRSPSIPDADGSGAEVFQIDSEQPGGDRP